MPPMKGRMTITSVIMAFPWGLALMHDGFAASSENGDHRNQAFQPAAFIPEAVLFKTL